MSDDLISRQAAIAEFSCCELTPDGGIDANYAIDFLRQLPSAQPERKEGRWIRKANWMWTCSCCGSDNAYAYKADDAYEPTVLQDFFCFNCGAEMEVEHETD